MKQNRQLHSFVCAAALAAACAVSATDYYVDAVNGNDSWDGTRPFETASGTAGPRKTLAAAMPLAGVGDTVYAAPGTYDQGEMWNASAGMSNRVVVLRGRRLVATAGRDYTTIKGKKSGLLKTGFGPDSVRCALLEGGADGVAGGIIKGFTLTGGYTFTNKSENCASCGGGIAGLNFGSVDGNGLAVDCNITGNYTSQRGANVFSTTLLRCRVGSANVNLDFYAGCKAIDSLFEDTAILYRKFSVYHCTFLSAKRIYSNSYNSYAYGCLFRNAAYNVADGQRMALSNCCFAAADPGTLTASGAPHINATCRFGLTAAELAESPLNTLRPTTNSVLAARGDLAQYLASTNGWAQAWQDEFNLTDYLGRPRLVDGHLTIGCLQSGVDHLYADAVNGDDAHDGLTAATAVKTLAQAMALSLPGDTIHAAEGVYDAGAMSREGTCSNRVVVLAGRKLVASGRRAETVIAGALATDAGGPNLNGCGTNALRCVYLERDANGYPAGIVKGFTLKNGRTYCNTANGVVVQSDDGDSAYNCGGGAAGSDGRGLVVDCDFVNCGSSCRGPNARGVTLLRCRIGTSACGDLDCYSECRLIDCQYGNSLRAYQNLKLYNCTFTSAASYPYSWGNQVPCFNCLFLNSSSPFFVHVSYTNCIAYGAWPASAPTGSDYDATTCRFGATAGEVLCADGARPWKGSIVLGAGSLAGYLSATNGWSDAWREEFNLTDLGGWPRVVDGKISVGCYEYAEMYVSPDGDDANDGLTAATAKATPAGVLASGREPMTVKLAAGTYSSETTVARGLATRAYVPAGWAFEGAGRGQTIIEGAADPDDSSLGLGPKAVRCAVVEANAYLRGVTLRNGRTDNVSGAESSIAGGVYLLGALVDSEITGCRCGRGQSTDCRGSAAYSSDHNGALIRCYVHDSLQGLPVYRCAMIGSVLAGSTYYGKSLLLNCWIGGDIKTEAWTARNPAYNCVVAGEVGRGYVATNCVICRPFTYYVNPNDTSYTNNGFDAATCLTNVDSSTLRASLDANWRPPKGSVLVDAGDRTWYHQLFPARWAVFEDGTDFAGGGRVRNGEIDIGAGEYTWLDDFAAVIAARNVAVTAAGEDVTVADGALVLSSGDTLAATWHSTRVRWAEFAFTAADGLTVTLNGVTLTPTGGIYRFRLNAGDNALTFAYAGTGTARLRDFALNGFALLLR